MTNLTRRGLLGAGGGLLSLGACSESGVVSRPEGRVTISPDERPGYPGHVSFDHGIASGDPLPDRVILWTHVTPDPEHPNIAIPVSYTVFEDEAMTVPVDYSEGFATPNRDFTVKVDVDGLKPGTVYYFRFAAKTTSGEVLSAVGRTKTTLASGDTPVKLAVISCSNYPFGRFHVYRELANTEDLDAIIHLGDYIYEYGIDGYGSEIGQAIDRNHEPPLEIITLDDYRTRHAQYKTDADLQAAHAAAPWLCTWDDHESANNSYRTGAENHNPEDNEGNWSDRKQAAVQAYLEWMPVRDPVIGQARESIYRRFDFGDVASILCLDTRLTGRSAEISWFTEIVGLDAEHVPAAAAATMERVNDRARTMLGAVQEDWLDTQLNDSAQSGKAWQVLANQVVMARVKAPNFRETLTQEQIDAQEVNYIHTLIDFSQLGTPWNLDAWDGYAAARERLYSSAKAAGARLVTLAGDTHTAWANTLLDDEGEQRGVEFACTSVTSPGFGTYMSGVDDLGQQFADANAEVDWFDPNGNGWTIVTLTKERAKADYHKVTDVTQAAYSTSKAATFISDRTATSLSPLKREL